MSRETNRPCRHCEHSEDVHEDGSAGLPRRCKVVHPGRGDSRGVPCSCNDYMPPKSETVNHPSHYGGDTTYEHIKVVRAWGLNYELGNATKYICRAGKKDQSKTLEDLEKAVWYLQAEIERRRQERK